MDLVVEPAGHPDHHRGLRLLHGDQPTPDQAAGYWLAQDLGPVLRRWTVSTTTSSATLTRLCRRLARWGGDGG